MNQERPSATILIVTKNRKDLLACAISSAIRQEGSIEVVVVDDGSTDGTSEFVRNRFPDVRLITHQESLGYVVRRNEGIAMASAPYVFSIDDDAEFTEPNIVIRALEGFSVPEAWAVALPFINVLKDGKLHQKPVIRNGWQVAPYFIGTAHAVRRDMFLAAGGYRAEIVHQGEEGDLAIRMLEMGKLVVVVDTPPIHHLETPRRDFRRVDYYGAKNAILFAWRNVPFPEVIGQIAMTTWHELRHAMRMKRSRGAYLSGMRDAYRAMIFRQVGRSPVSRNTFWLFRWLVRAPRSLSEVRGRLRALGA